MSQSSSGCASRSETAASPSTILPCAVQKSYEPPLRQSNPHSSTFKTDKATLWHIQDSQGLILALDLTGFGLDEQVQGLDEPAQERVRFEERNGRVAQHHLALWCAAVQRMWHT